MSADDMILYIENSEDSTEKLQELIKESVKFQDTNSINRNTLYFYTLRNTTKRI